MKKFIILIVSLSFFAASCDAGGLLDFGGGTKGVFKSEDNGETFNPVVKLGKSSDISNTSINAITLDPTNPDILFAGAAAGIYKSENAAASWTYVLSGIGVADIAVDMFSPKTVYAAGIVGQNGKIIKSIDGGTSWVDIYTEPSKTNTVLSVQISRTDSSVLLAGLLSGEVIRSTDAGRTWQTTKDFADKVIEIKFGPSNTAYALTTTKGLFRSTDLGVSWLSMTDTLTTQTLNSLNNSAKSASVFYDLALDTRQNGVLYLGTEQGLFRTVNDGKDWSFLSLPVKNGALRVSAVTVSPNNSNNLLVSVVSTLYKSVNGGLTWETRSLPSTAFIHTIVMNPSALNIIYLGLRSQ